MTSGKYLDLVQVQGAWGSALEAKAAAMKYDVTIVIVGGVVPVILNRGRRGPTVLHIDKRHYDYYVGTPAESPLFEIDQTEARGLRGGAKNDAKSNKSDEVVVDLVGQRSGEAPNPGLHGDMYVCSPTLPWPPAVEG